MAGAGSGPFSQWSAQVRPSLDGRSHDHDSGPHLATYDLEQLPLPQTSIITIRRPVLTP